MRIILASLAGMLIGGASCSLVVSHKGPVFHWEMAGMAMVIICGVFGGITGGLSAYLCSASKVPIMLRGFVGLCGGAVLGLAVGLFFSVSSSANHPKAPEGLAFWVVAVVVIAGGLAGLFGSLLAKTSNSA
ncbi:hypothetical protein [Bythopirellula polymerisocia]|nr:hypothetical protein [Bythopirellula polymerisocia]